MPSLAIVMPCVPLDEFASSGVNHSTDRFPGRTHHTTPTTVPNKIALSIPPTAAVAIPVKWIVSVIVPMVSPYSPISSSALGVVAYSCRPPALSTMDEITRKPTGSVIFQNRVLSLNMAYTCSTEAKYNSQNERTVMSVVRGASTR